MGGFIGGILIEVIGAIIKWSFFNLFTVFTNKKPISYKNYTAQKESVDDYELISVRGSDFFIGLIFCALVLVLIHFFY